MSNHADRAVRPVDAEWRPRTWFTRDRPALADVLAAKQGQRISVVLPALNEQDTVGAIVQTLRSTWMDSATPLVDELVVLDSGSTDDTAARAQDAGAIVVHRDDVVGSIPAVLGKGEAMWRSLFATSGDIVVFLDADLHDLDPDVVPALVAPLLIDDHLELIKGFGDRPVSHGATVDPLGGGRVTELVARPLLSMHWPELAGLIQPLIGEYAARRRLLEQLPFVCGYGVELAMLIDTVLLHGADVIGQAELGERHHRHQDLPALGRMAAELWQVALDRLERDGQIVVVAEPAPQLTQFTVTAGEVTASDHAVALVQRPPARSLAEYASGISPRPA